MRDLAEYISTHPGREVWPGGAFARLHLAPAEGQFAHHGANHFARNEKGITLLSILDGLYVNGGLTETKTNSSTIAQTASGLRFQTQATPTDGDNVEIIGLRAATPLAGTAGINGGNAYWIASTRLQVSSAANFGCSFGFVTAGTTGVVASDPANGFYFRKAKNSANLIGSTIQGGGTRHDTGTLLALSDAIDVVVTVKAWFNATQASCGGEWWVNGVLTPFSSAQATDVFNMIAGAPSLSTQLGFVVNGTTQRNAIVQWALGETDR